MEYLVIFLVVMGWDLWYNAACRKEDRAERIEHRAEQLGEARPALDTKQRRKAAKRAVRADGAYQWTHGFPRLRGDLREGWKTAKDAHHDWVTKTGKKPGLRNAVKAARAAHREKTRNRKPCADCGATRRSAFRDKLTTPRWLCWDCWWTELRKPRPGPSSAGRERERQRQKPADPPPQGERKEPTGDGDQPFTRGRTWWRRDPPPADPPERPMDYSVRVGDPLGDPADPPVPDPPAIDRGQQAIPAAPPAAPSPTGPAGPSKGDTPVSDLMPSAGGLPAVTGEIVGIDTARQQLGAFEKHADAFRILAERIQAATAQAQQEAMRMQAAADAMSASFEHAEVDPATLAEAAAIFEQLALLTAALKGLETAAQNVYEAADGVGAAAETTRRGMNTRHSGVEEAVKGAPVPRTAKREFYED